MRILIALTAAVSLFFVSCMQQNKTQTIAVADYFAPQDSGVQTAGIKMIPVTTPVGTFKVWTKTIGNNPRIKVLLLHGGPAFTHEYMECFESFFPQQGFEMIEYDQLGSYYSDQPTDSSLWTTERFVEEVEQVRKALGLNKDNFYLLGNSWGGLLAMEYALKYQENLKGLIVCNMVASIRAYEDSTYQTLVFNEYYKQHLCRLADWPDPLWRAFKHVNQQIYVMMQGPSEFKTGGRLLHWDRSKDLPQITVPTLMVGAHYETMDPDYMKWMSTQVKQGRYLYCPEGSHLAMWDDQKHFYPGIIQFINDVDSRNFSIGK